MNRRLSPRGVKHRSGDAARLLLTYFDFFALYKIAEVDVQDGETVVVMIEGGGRRRGRGVLPGD